jgi:hypothetical protein
MAWRRQHTDGGTIFVTTGGFHDNEHAGNEKPQVGRQTLLAGFLRSKRLGGCHADVTECLRSLKQLASVRTVSIEKQRLVTTEYSLKW